MKVNIYGLSEATISFTTIGIMLRGNDGSPCSIAKNLTIEREEQISELKQIEALGLVRVEEILEKVKKDQEKAKEAPKEAEKVDRLVVEEVVEEVEEPKKAKKSEKTKKTKKNSRRQPKKAKKAKKEKAEPRIAPEPILEDSDIEPNSDVIVMTATGPKNGKTVNKINGEIDENEPRCEASMEAARKLEAEEEATVIDDSLLDQSERMNQNAVIGTGNGTAKSIKMENSALGEMAEPHFIDLGFDDEDNVKDAFVDIDNDNDNGFGDAFIEI